MSMCASTEKPTQRIGAFITQQTFREKAFVNHKSSVWLQLKATLVIVSDNPE